MTSDSEQAVYTNGVYIAYDPNSSSFAKRGDSIIAEKSIMVIRFVSQQKAIIIPQSVSSDNEFLDTSKVRLLYNWCLNYGTKSPGDRDYIQIQPRFENDSIRFSQATPDSKTIYKGINYRDSIKLTYQVIYQGNRTIKPKELTFKFYKLN
jgi:hypothetical protein